MVHLTINTMCHEHLLFTVNKVVNFGLNKRTENDIPPSLRWSFSPIQKPCDEVGELNRET